MNNKLIFGVVFISILLLSIFLTSGETDCTSSTHYTTCNTYGCLNITDSGNDIRAVFDGGGFIDVEGSYAPGDLGSPDGNDFIIQDSGGSTVLWIDGASGDIHTNGQIFDDTQAYCTPPPNSFVIRDSSGNCVAYINSTGDVWARGRLCYNANI